MVRRACWLAVAAAIGALMILGGLTPNPALAATPQVTGIEAREQGGAPVVAIEMSRRVDYRVFVLNEPMRAIIDLPPMSWALSGTMAAPRGLVAGYRYGLFDPTTS